MGEQYRPSHREGPPSGQFPHQQSYAGVEQWQLQMPPGMDPNAFNFGASPPLPPGPPLGFPMPFPPGPLPMYQFGQQQQFKGSFGAQNQFSFQANANLPAYPSHREYTNPYPGQFGRNDRGARRNPRGPFTASSRPLLRTRRGDTPDQLEGMDGDDAPRFRNIDEMSDSEEEVMQESEAEDEVGGKQTSGVPLLTAIQTSKWSNPEVYTALPPTQETSKKKKDVVKLIRKARVAPEKVDDNAKQLAQNEDFVSFDFEDDQEQNVLPPNGPGPQAGHRSSSNLEQPSDNMELMQHPEVPNSIATKLENGKRKRVDDDEVVPPTPKRVKVPKGAASDGRIRPEWAAEKDTTPWLGEHCFTKDAGFRLHKEICDFYDFVKPRDFEQTMRLDLLERLRNSMRKYASDCNVHSFGSFAAGLYLPDADMDIVVVTSDFSQNGIPKIGTGTSIYGIAAWVVSDGLAAKGSVETIVWAKVPLVKFVDKRTGLRVDMSFENLTGVQANTTFAAWKAIYPAMPVLVTVVKQFLLMRGLNEVVNGGIGGFSVTCLVVSLLQNMPRIQNGELLAEQNLGEVLLEFLDFYGNQFDLSRTAIKLNPPGLVQKASVVNNSNTLTTKWNRLHIVDPNNSQNDISGGSKNVEFIFDMFAKARAEILRAMRTSSNTKSLLESVLGGNYDSYAWHRQHLKKLFHAHANVNRFQAVNVDIDEHLQNPAIRPLDEVEGPYASSKPTETKKTKKIARNETEGDESKRDESERIEPKRIETKRPKAPQPAQEETHLTAQIPAQPHLQKVAKRFQRALMQQVQKDARKQMEEVLARIKKEQQATAASFEGTWGLDEKERRQLRNKQSKQGAEEKERARKLRLEHPFVPVPKRLTSPQASELRGFGLAEELRQSFPAYLPSVPLKITETQLEYYQKAFRLEQTGATG